MQTKKYNVEWFKSSLTPMKELEQASFDLKGIHKTSSGYDKILALAKNRLITKSDLILSNLVEYATDSTLGSRASKEILLRLARKDSLGEAWTKKILDISLQRDYDKVLAILLSKKLSPELFSFFVKSYEKKLSTVVASKLTRCYYAVSYHFYIHNFLQNRYVPGSILQEFYSTIIVSSQLHRTVSFIKILLSRNDCPQAIIEFLIEKLERDGSIWERRDILPRILKHPSCPKNVINDNLKDCMNILFLGKSSLDIHMRLESLSVSPDREIFEKLSEIFQKRDSLGLSLEFKSAAMRSIMRGLAQNPLSSSSLLEEIFDLAEKNIDEDLKRDPDRHTYIEVSYRSIHDAVLKNKNVPLSILSRMALSKNPNLRRLAKNQSKRYFLREDCGFAH